jgi:Holliday junction resolvasome RuvABC ATP-dependent DNA helicase subunit
MTATTDFTAATRTAQDVFATTLDSWKNGLSSLTDRFGTVPTVAEFPKVDLTEAVERQFAFIQQVVDLNHQYARQLAEVAETLTGVTRSQLESVGSVVRDQVVSITDLAPNGVDTVEQPAADQAAAKAAPAKRTTK